MHHIPPLISSKPGLAALRGGMGETEIPGSLKTFDDRVVKL